MHEAWSVGHAVLTLRGELDQPAASAVSDKLAAICQRQPLRLFVDMADVTGVSGVVLGKLATVVGRLRENGCPLLVITPTGATREQLHRHGLEDLLRLN